MRLLPRTARGTWLLAGAAWLTACAVVWWVLPARPRAAFPMAPGEGLLTVLPDGRGGVSARERDGTFTGPIRIWHASANRSGSYLTEQDQIKWADVSPDGRWVLSWNPRRDSRQVSLLDTASGQSVPIALGADRGKNKFSPDGRWLAFTD